MWGVFSDSAWGFRNVAEFETEEEATRFYVERGGYIVGTSEEDFPLYVREIKGGN